MDGLGVVDGLCGFENVSGEHGGLAADHALVVECFQGEDRLKVGVVADRPGQVGCSLGP